MILVRARQSLGGADRLVGTLLYSFILDRPRSLDGPSGPLSSLRGMNLVERGTPKQNKATRMTFSNAKIRSICLFLHSFTHSTDTDLESRPPARKGDKEGG